MKLRNKNTGEVVNFIGLCVEDGRYELAVRLSENNEKWFTFYYSSIAELNENWEDYEEPKEYYWFIDDASIVSVDKILCSKINMRKSIGNYFETKEEAEKAIEKLKAWKRLKDKGFRFTGWATNEGIRGVDFEVPDSFFSAHNHSCISDETKNDLDLLFGGEE